MVWAGTEDADPTLVWLGWYEDLLAAASGEPPAEEPLEDDLAELFYTSGTTAKPKGVMLSHRNLYAHAFSVLTAVPIDDACVQIHTLPLFHVNGWGTPHTVTAVGGRHIVLPRFDAGRVLALIARERVTHMFLVPTMAISLLEHPWLEGTDRFSLRRILVGGAAAAPSLIGRLERAFACTVTAAYGMTEASPFLTVSGLKAGLAGRVSEEERLRRLAMTGLPVPGAEIRVVDWEMRPVAHDGASVGELVARGDMVMEGYLGRPAETAEALRDGWLHTGDLAVWDAEGYIQIVDRSKDIIISGGENVSSIEVEAVLAAHPDVVECAVVARPDPRWGEVPVAYVVARLPHADAADIIAFARQRLAHFKVPRHVRVVAELPKTGSGKIQKRILRAMEAES
jgi:fatty-acyl-CoA synthase